jgi:hypothetical protein
MRELVFAMVAEFLPRSGQEMAAIELRASSQTGGLDQPYDAPATNVSMTQFGTSLRFVELPAMAELLAKLGSTGRLRVTHGAWTGEIAVRRGQLVSASLGVDSGLAALESMAIGIHDGELSFVEAPVTEEHDILVDAERRCEYMDGLNAERKRLAKIIPSLDVVPRLVEGPADSQVNVAATALRTLPGLLSGQTLEHLARQRGLGRTLREVRELLEAGLLRLDPPSALTVPRRAVFGSEGLRRFV